RQAHQENHGKRPAAPHRAHPANRTSTSPDTRTRHHPYPSGHRRAPQHVPTHKQGFIPPPDVSLSTPPKEDVISPRFLSTPAKRSVIPTGAQRSGGTPAFRFCRCLFSSNNPNFHPNPRRHFDRSGAKWRNPLLHHSPSLSGLDDHSWLLYPIPASTPRM